MNNRVFGYIRISSPTQNEASQIAAMREFGIDDRDIYIDKKSGKDFDREEYQLMLRNIRKGDLVVFRSLDRMGRNYTQIQQQWRYITQTLEADIKILDIDLLDTRCDNSSLDRRFICDLVLQILAFVSEKERQNIRYRQAAGIKEAHARNVKFGRKQLELPDNFEEVAKLYLTDKIKAKDAVSMLNMKRSSFYKQINLFSNK